MLIITFSGDSTTTFLAHLSLFAVWFVVLLMPSAVLLHAIYFVDQVLHVLETALFLPLTIVLDRIKQHGHELHLVNFIQYLSFNMCP